MHIEGT